MPTVKYPWLLVLIICLPIVARAQLLGGDPQFPLLNEIRWEMKADEIRSLCENWKALLRTTDTTLTFQARILNVSAKAKIQFDPTTQLPRMIDIAFEESTGAIRDTIIGHFTRSLGRPPLVTAKEKNAIIFTIKMEVASWRSEKEMINVMSMMRGNTVLGISILITKATILPKGGPQQKVSEKQPILEN